MNFHEVILFKIFQDFSKSLKSLNFIKSYLILMLFYIYFFKVNFNEVIFELLKFKNNNNLLNFRQFLIEISFEKILIII